MDKLTIKQKVNLFKDLYTELSGYGTLGDTELAHVNKYEVAVLKAMGGSGTVNEVTGLKQYGGFFGDDEPAPAPAPTSTTVRQVSDLPEYFKPYAEKVLATAEQVYDKPYVPYEDRRLAPVTEEQQLAFTGLRDLFTGVDPTTGERQFRSPTAGAFETAEGLAGKGAAQFGELEEGVFEEKYMSPYTKAVTDIQVREAQRRADEQRKQLASSAMKAGALGSSRFGVQEALRGEAEQRLLSDIEQQGLQRAFEQGQQAFDADRSAARAGATQYGSLGVQGQAAGLTGLGALQTTGETQRAIGQQPLDVSYEEFVRQQNYPRQSLQELGGILRGFPVTPSTYRTTQQFQQAPTLGSQLLTAGTLGAGIAKGLGKSLLGAGGGLMDVLPEGYVHGGDVVPPELRSSYPDINRPTIRVEDLDDRFLARLTDDQLEAFIQISNYSSDDINELIIKRNRILGKDAPIRTPIPRPPTSEERQRRIQTLSDRIEPLAPTLEEKELARSFAAAIEGWKQFEPEARMIDVGLTQTPEERVVDKRAMEDRANEDRQRRMEIQSQLLKETPVWGKGMTGIEEMGEDDPQKMKSRITENRKKGQAWYEREGYGVGGKKTQKELARYMAEQPWKEMSRNMQGLDEGVGYEEDSITKILANQAIPPAVEEGKVSPVSARTTDDTPIFDLVAALPFFEMAAEFGKAGRSTADAAKAALAGFEKTTSARAAGKAEADYKKTLGDYYTNMGIKARGQDAIERAKAGAKLNKDEMTSAISLIKTQLTALKILAGGDLTNFSGLPPEIQEGVMQLARNAAALGTNLTTIDSNRISFESPVTEVDENVETISDSTSHLSPEEMRRLMMGQSVTK